MHDLDRLDDNDDGTVFRDVIMLTLLGFVTIVVILLPHLNPPVKADDISNPGNLMVQASWPADVDTDVDLWVQAPGDDPVGYANRGGKVFNLLRDDLGSLEQNDNSNFEVAFSRGTPAGEYIVNVHLYSNRSLVLPLKTTVDINLQRGRGGALTKIASIPIVFRRIGEERTVLRFKLDNLSRLVAGSQHTLYKPLRTGEPTLR